MALTITMKQHDTRPLASIQLLEPNPAAPNTQQIVDLSNAASARLIVGNPPATAIFTSVLGLVAPLTLGTVLWTPVAGDSVAAGTFSAEIQVTFLDGGIETYPNNGYFTIVFFPDIPNAFGILAPRDIPIEEEFHQLVVRTARRAGEPSRRTFA